jgi:DNA-directed RNA polymerase specialized sigma24 family protein
MNDELGSHAEFPPTHWTLVAAAAAPDSAAALGRLYETYWPPLRAQALRFGVREEDVGDVLQELFMALFRSGSLARAEPARGRFRSYLLGALRNFLNHRRANLQTEKRGGGRRPIPLMKSISLRPSTARRSTSAPLMRIGRARSSQRRCAVSKPNKTLPMKAAVPTPRLER